MTTSIGLKRSLFIGVAIIGLAGCSGSSGGGGSTPPSNAVPVFGPDESITINENTLAVATASATDADGDVLTYSVSGGDDGDLFSIDANSGALVFLAAPDFETPIDSNTDNLYDVVVSAIDPSGASATINYTVLIADAMETRYIDPIFPETSASEDIVYATTDGEDYVLNIISPVGDTELDRPLILFASGGAFVFTDRDLMLPFAENYARTGYVTAVMDYRTEGGTAADAAAIINNPGSLDINATRISALDATHDMIAAVRFLKANADTYGFNPEKVFVGGTSAGAVLAATVATTDPDDPVAPSLVDYLNSVGGVYGEIGDHLDQSPDVQGALAISGTIYDLFTIDSESAPIYGAHNELDPVAPCYTVNPAGADFSISGTCDYIPYLQAVGVPAGSLIVLGDTGHVDFSDEEYQQIFSESRQLFLTTGIEPVDNP
ncbi:MAG: alpha/beta hydrolase fold domain-containing protein [Pseudomonadota bacterium]